MSLKGKHKKTSNHLVRNDFNTRCRYKGDGDLRFELSFNMSNQTEMVQLACELPDVLGGLTITPEVRLSSLSCDHLLTKTLLDQESFAQEP